jgi:hypothetical protein
MSQAPPRQMFQEILRLPELLVAIPRVSLAARPEKRANIPPVREASGESRNNGPFGKAPIIKFDTAILRQVQGSTLAARKRTVHTRASA